MNDASSSGLFLDFTGQEDVLEKLRGVSNDLNHDIICILSALLDGDLRWRTP